MSTVTWRSCMHSSSPDWVLGEARLTSSTSTMLAKIGPGWNSKPRVALVEDVGADQVGGQQVGGALKPRVLGVDRAGERTGQGRLADPRVVLDQDVAVGEQGDQQVADDLVADLDRPLQVVPQPLTQLRHGG